MTRRGFVLLEAVVALLLATALTLAALASLSGLQRHAALVGTRGQATTTGLAALQLLRSELATVAPEAGDLLVASSRRLVYRAVRGSGVSCGVASDGLLVRAAAWRSLRLPSPGRDTVLVFHAFRGWEPWALRGPPRAATCPDGATALLLPLTPGFTQEGTTVVRTIEVMELRFYQSDGATWLGLRSVSAGEVIQPVLGPLEPRSASFSLLDAAGQPADPLSGARLFLANLTAEVPGFRADHSGHPGVLRARIALGATPPP